MTEADMVVADVRERINNQINVARERLQDLADKRDHLRREVALTNTAYDTWAGIHESMVGILKNMDEPTKGMAVLPDAERSR
ncbi:hypothetical protein [Cellulosimicrobium phage DS1]|nr:hypothetical protein [Cellulosimicrobium phage DS1]